MRIREKSPDCLIDSMWPWIEKCLSCCDVYTLRRTLTVEWLKGKTTCGPTSRLQPGVQTPKPCGLQLLATPSPTIFLGSTISSNRFSSMYPDLSAASFKVRPSSFALCAIADALS